MKLLTGDAIAREITKLVKKRGGLRAAVAFWGAGAAADTGLESKDKGQILCDLFSGGCNPDEVKKLMDYGLDVKTLHGMHAKLWINGGSVILGSANASTNGLGFEQKTMKTMTGALRNIPNTEVNVLIRDRNFSEAAVDWFDRQWDHAKPVTDRELKDAKSLWRRRKRRGSGRVSDTSILTAMKKPELRRHFAKLKVIATSEERSDDAQQIFEEINRKRKYIEEQEIDFYELAEKKSRGTVYMDFVVHCRGNRKTKGKFRGMWKVVETAEAQTEDGYRVVVVSEVSDFLGYRFPEDDQKEMKERLDYWLENSDEYGEWGFLECGFGKFLKKTEDWKKRS